MSKYKLVLVEPTDEEISAMEMRLLEILYPEATDYESSHIWRDRMKEIRKAMLAATPDVNPWVSVWVSVMERLPDDDGYYLVMNDGCVVLHQHIPIVMRWNLGKWYNHNLSAFYDGVTHWMPIPRPKV